MKFDIVRAWKEEAYRASLSTEQQATLPENPVGTLELSDAELEAIHGAARAGGDVSNNCTAPEQWGVAMSTPQTPNNSSYSVGATCVSN